MTKSPGDVQVAQLIGPPGEAGTDYNPLVGHLGGPGARGTHGMPQVCGVRESRRLRSWIVTPKNN